MKPGRNKKLPDKQQQGTATEAQPASRASKPIPAMRRRLYKAILIVLPVLGLLLLEVVLRFAGVGYEAGFLIPSRVRGQHVFIENSKFGWRFFPKPLARTPQPMTVAAVKPPETIRVLVLGESAAMGDPEPAYGMARMLEVLLQEAFPQQRFEVINAAMTAINSHAILPIARDCAPLKCDFWVVYMGNNEVVGPFGSGTVFGPQAPPLFLARLGIWMKKWKLGQLFDAARESFQQRGGRMAAWGGMEMFLQQQVRADWPGLKNTYRNFERNLADILREGRRQQAHVFLCTVAANLKDCAPLASQHRPNLNPEEADVWRKNFEAAQKEYDAGNYEAAIRHYEIALRIDDEFAELHYRLGKCLLAIGRHKDAQRSFIRARDLDTLRFRVDTALNEIIRRTASHENLDHVSLVDAESILGEASPVHIPGAEFFWEHVHLNFYGNYRLSRALAEGIAQAMKSRQNPPSFNGRLAGPETVYQRLALTDWNRLKVAEHVLRRLEQPPFTNQADHEMQLRQLRNQIATLQASVSNEPPSARMAIYQEALRRRPDDWQLVAGYAELLQETGNITAAIEQYRRLIEMLPHSPLGHYQLGNLLDRLGQTAEAIACFENALKLKPDSLEAHNGLGLCLLNQQKLDDAIKHFQTAISINPKQPTAYINLALAWTRQGNKQKARQLYLQALQLDTNSVAARLNLGKLLREEGDNAGAVVQYSEAVRLAPNDPFARFNLGNALVALQRFSEAASNYQAAVAIAPGFIEARIACGLELARQGRLEEAREQFAEAVRIQPENIEARLNLGVALGKLRRPAEALEQFEAIIKTQPQNAAAHFNIGLIYLQQNNRNAARKYFETVLRLDPNHAAARQRLTELEQ